MSQTTDIIEYVIANGSITTKQAMDDIGCYRLASRISEMKKSGIPVQREMVTVKNRNGDDCRVARYTFPCGFNAVTV